VSKRRPTCCTQGDPPPLSFSGIVTSHRLCAMRSSAVHRLAKPEEEIGGRAPIQLAFKNSNASKNHDGQTLCKTNGGHRAALGCSVGPHLPPICSGYSKAVPVRHHLSFWCLPERVGTTSMGSGSCSPVGGRFYW
jgi:hypothetical protein